MPDHPLPYRLVHRPRPLLRRVSALILVGALMSALMVAVAPRPAGATTTTRTIKLQCTDMWNPTGPAFADQLDVTVTAPARVAVGASFDVEISVAPHAGFTDLHGRVDPDGYGYGFSMWPPDHAIDGGMSFSDQGGVPPSRTWKYTDFYSQMGLPVQAHTETSDTPFGPDPLHFPKITWHLTADGNEGDVISVTPPDFLSPFGGLHIPWFSASTPQGSRVDCYATDSPVTAPVAPDPLPPASTEPLFTTIIGGAEAPAPPYWRGWDIARDVVVNPSGNGGWVLDGWGGLHPFGGAPPLRGAPYWRGWDIARDVVLNASGSGYVLDGWGGLHPVNGAPRVSGSYWRGWDIARKVVLNPTGPGGWVLDGWGGVHPFGGARPLHGTPYWRGWDIARDLVVNPDGTSGYVLDGWGGVHPFGGATPVGSPSYTPGIDIAKGLTLTGSGSGYVLDGWGGVHPFGGAPPLHGAPYWRGWNIARALALHSSGSGYVLDGWGGLHAVS